MKLCKGTFKFDVDINIPFGKSDFPQFSQKNNRIVIKKISGNNFWGKFVQPTESNEDFQITRFTGVKTIDGILTISTLDYSTLSNNGERLDEPGNVGIIFTITRLNRDKYQIKGIKPPGETSVSIAKFYRKKKTNY